MPKYLQQRYRTWYAVLEIPKVLRPKLGGARFFRSLKTDSQRLAEMRAMPLVAEWKRLIEAARTGNEPLELEAHRFRQAIEGARSRGEDEADIEHMGKAVAEVTKGLFGREDTGTAFEIARNRKHLLSEHLDAYLATQRDLQQKSQDMKASDLRRFSRKFRFAEDADRFSIIAWVENDLMAGDGLSEATCRRIISANKGYWEFLQRHKGLTLPKPFDDVVPARRRNRRTAEGVRRAFAPRDYRRLMEATSERDQSLRDLIMLGAHTGARIEELCSLPLTAVLDDRFQIEDAKTPAGHRDIPIHSHITDRLNDLVKASSDGFLLSGLTNNKYGDRSNAIGKRFGRLKTALGYGRPFVFHSFRKGVATQFEQNSIPENEAARLLGHEFNTMTYGLYSGGNIRFERLKEIIEGLQWE